MRSRFSPWICAVAGLTILQIAATVVLRPGTALTAVTDSVSVLLFLTLLLNFAAHAVSGRGRMRSIWTLLALGWAFWLADECVWMFYDLALRRPLPAMFPGDVLLFLSGVPVLAALLLRPHIESSAQGIRLGRLDFLQLMLWWLYFYVYLVMCWQYVHYDAVPYNRNFDRLYLLQFLIVVICGGVLFGQARGSWRRFYVVFFAAIIFTYLSVMVQNRAIESGVYYGGSWYDIPFAASLAFFAFVAGWGRQMTPGVETSADRKYASWLSGLAAVAVLSLPVMAAYAVLDRSVPPEIASFRVLVTLVTMLIMSTLVFAKLRRLHIDLIETNAVLQHASITDPLTGIRNRRFFSETIEADVARSLRAFTTGQDAAARDLIFYLIDLDNFKKVNEGFGHHAGDRVLTEAAQRINSVVRTSDVLLRWGGEEFLVISRFADRNQAEILALRVTQAMRQAPFVIGDDVCLRQTCSVGWAAFPWNLDDPAALGYEAVLEQADHALGEAKRAGKDRAIGMTHHRSNSSPELRICAEAQSASTDLEQAFNS